MDSLNLLLVSGTLERVHLRFREDGTCVCTGSLRIDDLGAQGTVYKTYIPFEGYSKVGELLGEQQVGDVVMLQGKVFWRRYRTKGGEEKNGLALLVQKCSLLALSPAKAPLTDENTYGPIQTERS
jgi:hypothetical protein